MKNSLFLCFFLCLFFAIFASLVAYGDGSFHSNPDIKGASFNVIHKASKLSPFYKKQQPAIFSTNKYQSEAYPDGRGDYIMELYIGYPRVKIFATIDTGSHYLWVQCAPCLLECYPQDVPMFNRDHSSTYVQIPCYDPTCQQDPTHACGISNPPSPQLPPSCIYNVTYGDKSYTTGFLAQELISMIIGVLDDGTEILVDRPNIIFGCGFDNVGHTFSDHSTGIVGLNMGSTSLVSQLGIRKFSYCLPPLSSGVYGKLRFGEDDFTYGSDLEVRTPLIMRPNSPQYYVNLEGATVAGKRIDNNQVNTTYGNIFLDSGSTRTGLDKEFYKLLATAVKSAISLTPIKEIDQNFHLCYTEFPKDIEVVIHFTGADVTLKPLNLFEQLDDNLVCFAMVPTDPPDFYYGNVNQLNFKVTHDLANKFISFAPAPNCAQV